MDHQSTTNELSPAASPVMNTSTNTMNTSELSPTASPSTSPRRSRASSRAEQLDLSLDLSNLPPLVMPKSPTNTLLITNLLNPLIFTPPHLTALRTLITSTSAPTSWSPLKSFRRIICTFASADDATTVRRALDGETILGDRVRIYFGEHTNLSTEKVHLQAPEAKKLFFISPPPSPPAGWESRDEAPPNEMMLAEDLVKALRRLGMKGGEAAAKNELGGAGGKAGMGKDTGMSGMDGGSEEEKMVRSRSGSVLLFEPDQEGEGKMPAISVDDYTDSADERSPVEPDGENLGLVHTQRPPVELMSDS